MSDNAEHHHDDPWSHVPPPSHWPVLVGLGLCLLPFAFLATIGLFDNAGEVLSKGTHLNGEPIGLLDHIFYPVWATLAALPGPLLVIAVVTVVITLMGWGHQIIKEKRISHDLVQQQTDLKMFTLLFFVSEAMAFGAIFGYLYIRGLLDGGFAKPEHIHLGGPLVAIATILLLSSSVTCEIAHKAMEHGRKGVARTFLLVTIILGVIFLGAQAYEYGELIVHGFTPKAYGESVFNAFAALFYVSTGFHGVHVATGLLMLFLVWLRMEFGHFDQKRHFSFIAASWYWHFVDVVWILLFTSVYVLLA